MADAETPTHGLAERLDEDATYWRDLHAEQPIRPGYEWMIELADRESAAAAQLRQLDRIKAALPPDEIIERMVVACRNVQDQGRPKNVEWFDWVPAQLERLRSALEADDGA